ncbi:MAG: thymidine phosphorylase [Calditrichaeota bacterium]|nr:MAG: thymidine phosphorylase [Calditrichota bacterium]
MNVYQIMVDKRDGKKLTADQIEYIISGFSKNRIPDYQMAAFLMAVYLKGMDFEETSALTKSMLDSGMRMNFSRIQGAKIDKHSTGGVGDKISLVLAPLVAAAGALVPMISGRSLGHSGGTLDKLESIPGFRTQLSIDEFYQQIERIGVSMIGQTEAIAPADKKIYALRDTTATIESVPLITSSILCKKLAEGIDGLVLDIKVGQGAFMKTVTEARRLAESMIKTAAIHRLPMSVVLTAMDQPLGYAAGNWLEIQEAVSCLHGEGPSDVMEVTFALGAEMLLLAALATNRDEAVEKLSVLVRNGTAFIKFCEMVEAQGGDVDVLHHMQRYPSAKIVHPIIAENSGYVADLNALTVGQAVVRLGGGRQVIEDRIDHKAGVLLLCKRGDRVKSGDRLALLYTDREKVVDEVAALLSHAFTISNIQPENDHLILESITTEM